MAEWMSVGQLAERSGVSISALHFYERKGLIESERTEGNQRRYRRCMLRRVALIRIAQRVGIPLSEVGAALDALPESRTPTVQDWEHLSSRWKSDLDARIHALEQLRDRFTGCIGCGCLSIEYCAMMNPGDELGTHGPGPRRLIEDPT